MKSTNYKKWEVIRDLLKKHDLTDYPIYRKAVEVLSEREANTPAVDDPLN
jgi:hypothetical protein